MSVMPTFRRLKQEDLKFKDSLGQPEVSKEKQQQQQKKPIKNKKANRKPTYLEMVKSRDKIKSFCHGT
jgi:hypothetical protein